MFPHVMRETARMPDGRVHFSLFETPMVGCMVPGHEALNAALVPRFLEMERDPVRYGDPRSWSNKFGALFESRWDLFEQPHPAIAMLREHCLALVYETAAIVNEEFWATAGVELAGLKTLVESWFHVTRNGGWHGLHKHANNSWSGVYFVRRGSAAPAYPKNGFLRLHDPRPNISMFHDMAMIPFSAGVIDIEPQDGKLIVFPSWLAHEVLPYFGDEPRITVAFNVSIHLGAR